MKNKHIISSILLVAQSVFGVTSYSSTDAAKPPLTYASYAKKPKLVLVIVIDQFRADYLSRFSERFLPPFQKNGDVGGFRYLMSKGAYFPMAHFNVLQNMTCPGHATILTGSYPAQSGIPINDWYDRKTDKMRYCVGDDIDGISPRQLVGTTVGDELKNAGYPGKVIALALKDRAAVLLGGHRSDLTFWLGDDGKWVTSPYYAKTLPDWLKAENDRITPDIGKINAWTQTKERTGFSQTRDHDFSKITVKGKFESLESPYGVELTTGAAIAALKGTHLGHSRTPDLLAVSYSTHDLEGHHVGPNAPEMEDLTVNEDQAIATLLNAVRKQVPGGLKNVVIALTADHGVSPQVDYLTANKIDAGFIDAKKLMADAEVDLTNQFGKPKTSWLAAVESFNFYFSNEALDGTHKGVTTVALENRMKAFIASRAGVAHVFSLSDFQTGHLPVGEMMRQIQKSYIPGKSGDIVLVPKPFWMEAGKPATHMTGYSYDRSVPLLIAGPHLRSGIYGQSVDVVDLAPTLSFLLGTIAPAQSEGRVLTEAIGD